VTAVGARRTGSALVLAVVIAATLTACCTAAAREHPYNKGCRLLAEDRYAAAAKQFKKALAISPADTDALNNLAVCNILLGKHTLARRQLEQALELNPRYAGAELNIGADRIIQEQPQLALPPTVAAGKAEGDSAAAVSVRAAAQYNLGLIALLRGDVSAAREAFAASAKIKRTPEAVLGTGVAAAAAGDYDAAVTVFEKAAAAGGALGRMARTDLAAAYYKQGTEHFAAGDFEAARRSLERSQEVRDGDAASLALALVDAETGDSRRAASTLQALKKGASTAELRRAAAVDLDRVLAAADRRSAWLKWLAAGLGVLLVALLIAALVRARRAPSWRRPHGFLTVAAVVLMPVTLAAAALVFLDPLRTPQQLAVVFVLDAVVLFFLLRKRTAA